MSTTKTTRRGLWMALAVAIGAIALMVPAVASADALVWNSGHGADCAFYVDGKVYRGSATVVITANGKVNESCYLSLESGTAVDRPTTTQIGNCELLETPSGQARASCHYEL